MKVTYSLYIYKIIRLGIREVSEHDSELNLFVDILCDFSPHWPLFVFVRLDGVVSYETWLTGVNKAYMLCHSKGDGPRGVCLLVVCVWRRVSPWDIEQACTFGAARGQHVRVYNSVGVLLVF